MTVSSLARPVPLPPQPPDARRELTRMLADEHWDGDIDGVLLAVHEAMVNAHRHGGGVTAAEAGLDGDTLVVEVADRGAGFGLPVPAELPDAAAERGRGLFLICQLASQVDVIRHRGEVRMLLRFRGRCPPPTTGTGRLC